MKLPLPLELCRLKIVGLFGEPGDSGVSELEDEETRLAVIVPDAFFMSAGREATVFDLASEVAFVSSCLVISVSVLEAKWLL